MTRALWASIAGALLPEPQRSALERRWGGDAPLVSFLLGIVEFIGGALWFYESAMGVLRPMADAIATEYLAQADQRTVGAEETLGFTWGGALLWVFWLIRPTTWFIISVPIVGLLRVAAFMTTRTSIAEPLVWALVRLVTLGRERADRARERAQFGAADEPDDVEAEGANELFVYTPRSRPVWTEGATIDVAGRYYRVTGLDFVERAGRRRFRYRLTEAGEHEVIRRYVAYELPKTGIRWAAAKAPVSEVSPAPLPPPARTLPPRG